MRESQEYVKLIRRYPNTNKGGGLIKIDSETLLRSIAYSGLPLDTPLQVKRYAVKGTRGTPEIILKFKPIGKTL